MRKLVLLFIALTITFFSYSQKISLGPKAGVSMSNVRGEISDPEMLVGFHAGGSLQIKINQHFAVSTDILYEYRGGGFSQDMSKLHGYPYSQPLINKQQLITVPVCLKIYPTSKIGLNLQLGVQPEYFFVNRMVVDQNTYDDELVMTFSGQEEQGFSLSIPFGFGYDITPNLITDLRYTLGLTNLTDEYFGRKNIHVIQVSLAYRFSFNSSNS